MWIYLLWSWEVNVDLRGKFVLVFFLVPGTAPGTEWGLMNIS